MERIAAPEDTYESNAVTIAIWALSAAAFVGVFAIVPDVMNLYWIRILTNVLLFTAMTQSINIIAGFVGYPAFGNVVFFGIGAYGTGVAMVKLQAPFIASLFLGLVLCVAIVLVVGPPLLRLRGHYFAIATLGLNEATKTIVNNLTELTGGGTGLSLPLLDVPVEETATFFYRTFLLLVVGGAAATGLLRQTRFGYAWRAIRANEEGAQALGINTTFYKTAAWLVSAIIAGAAGSLYARWLSYIEPASVFDMTISVKAFVMFLLGGAATIFGPFMGAAMIEVVTTLTWSHLLKYHLAVLGTIIMIAAVLMPQGFQSFLRGSISHLAVMFRRGP